MPDLEEQISEMLDNQSLDDVIPVLGSLLAYALVAAFDKRKERLMAYEAFCAELLKEITDPELERSIERPS